MANFSAFSNKEHRTKEKKYSSRFLIVALFMVVMLIIIFVRTSILQLSSAEVEQIPETVGQRAQMRVQAPRGDIVDLNGETLAYSITQPMLYISNANLPNRALNSSLLELSNLLIENGVQLPNNLTNYFAYASDARSKTVKSKTDFVFKKDFSDIEKWQQNKDLFNLKTEAETDRKSEQVKLDPAEFYDYLLFDKFEIESKEAGGDLIYTVDEAFRIMQLRYLILEHNWQFLQGEAIEVGGPVNQKIINTIEEQNQRYAGVLIADVSSRQYTEDSQLFSHVLGYTGNISESEYQQLKQLSYGYNDVVGKSGVEYSAERYLHGTPGTIPYGYWQRNSEGEAEYIRGRGGIDPKPGNKVRLTLSKDLQSAALDALSSNLDKLRAAGNHPNASVAVLMDVKTGAVLSMASIPYYNPQDFSLADFDQEAADRVEDYFNDNETKPMLNRAISEIYAPASTFKTFTSIAALENGVIDRNNQVYVCNGIEEIGYRVWKCYSMPETGHGPLTLHDAMVTSCNLYFFKMGIDTGIDKLSATYKMLGMGEYTNIDLPGEVKGYRPSPQLKRETQILPEDQIWFPADTAQSAIGQSYNSYTIMQMARGVGAIATGNLVQPHVIKEITDVDGRIVKPEVISVENLGISAESIAMVREAMEGLAYDQRLATYNQFNDYPVPVAMKTGTAEVQNSSSENIQINSLFVCYAPADNPEVVFAGVVENSEKGSGLPEVARKILDAYFGFEPKNVAEN